MIRSLHTGRDLSPTGRDLSPAGIPIRSFSPLPDSGMGRGRGSHAWLLAALAAALLAPSPCGASRIRGVTLAPIEDGMLGPVGYGSDRCGIAIGEIAELGATWISITPFGRVDDAASVDVEHDFEIPVARNEELIRRTAAMAKARGLRVAIIPHVYVMSGEWRGEIDPGPEEAWCAWFAAYREYLLRFAALAEEVGADLLSIGVEFKSSTNFYEADWRELIADVRGVYKGPLTYSANWDEVDAVPFWDALDAIGVNAFWPLAGKPGDGYEAMRDRAARVADELEGIAFYYDRPVLFTEMGVKSATDSALAPWEWPEHCAQLRYDETYQAEAYQAVLEALAERPWFWGMFVWKYFSDPYDETQEAREGFSPRGKLAEGVLARWYRRSWDPSWLDLQAE